MNKPVALVACVAAMALVGADPTTQPTKTVEKIIRELPADKRPPKGEEWKPDEATQAGEAVGAELLGQRVQVSGATFEYIGGSEADGKFEVVYNAHAVKWLLRGTVKMADGNDSKARQFRKPKKADLAGRFTAASTTLMRRVDDKGEHVLQIEISGTMTDVAVK